MLIFIGWAVWDLKHTQQLKWIIGIAIFYLIFKVLETLTGDIYDFHQIFALIVPPVIYVAVVMAWGLLPVNKSLIPKILVFLVFIICTNVVAIKAENERSFNHKPADAAFLKKVFNDLAPGGLIKTVYCSQFTLMPYIHYDRVGDELLHHTDHFTTTLFAVDLFTRADTMLAHQMGAMSYFNNLPLARYLQLNKCNGHNLDSLRLKFLRDNQVSFVLRRHDYERSRLNFLNQYIIDSAYNHQFDYQLLKLKFQ